MEKHGLCCKSGIVTNNGSDLHGGHSGSYDSFLEFVQPDLMPPGFRFKPSDEELVYYLTKKIAGAMLPPNKINRVELYKFDPDTLAEIYKLDGEDGKIWYFFTPRDKKYRNGSRPNRAAGKGYWKATGSEKPVKVDNAKVGSKTALVYFRGKPQKGVKTNWKMHEYKVSNQPKPSDINNDMKLDDWVLCRIYKSLDKLKASNQWNGVRIDEQRNGGSNLQQDDVIVVDEGVDHPPDQQPLLLSNQNYYSNEQSETLNCTNVDMGYDGGLGVEPSAPPLQLSDWPSEFDDTFNIDQWLNDQADNLPSILP